MALTTEQQSALDILTDALRSYGLESLSEWALDRILSGAHPSVVMGELRESPEYKARFPAMEQLRREGRAITEGEYVAYEKNVREAARLYGVPQGMFDRDYMKNMLIKDVSTREFEDRLMLAKQASLTAPAETRQALKSMYGMSDGEMTAYWLDPDKSMPLIQKRFDAAQVAGAGLAEKFSLSAADAERYASGGATYESARRALSDAARLRGLTEGMDLGTTVAEKDLVESAFGSGAAGQKIQDAQQKRRAQFAGGGSAAESQQGVTGLRRASPRVQ